MPFDFEQMGLAGLVVITPRVFPDDRGSFFESYKQSEFHAAGIKAAFVQDNCSISTKGVLRGLHYQLPPYAQGKLVYVTRGAVWDVCVDLRRNSPTFKQWMALELSDENHRMLYIPPGFGHGFFVLSDVAYFEYKCTREYAPGAEQGIRYDDPELNIPWPEREYILSDKDQAQPLLADAVVFEEAAP